MSADELMAQAAELSRQAALSLAEERRSNRQRKVSDMMRRSAVPGRYQSAALQPMVEAQREAFACARAFVAEFSAHLEAGSGMLLWGGVGAGKTHLACAVANALMAQGRQALYCTALEAVMLVKSTWRRGDGGMTEYEVYERFGSPELLIIDEIGVQSGTDFERLVLTSIADIRSRECLPTIAVSNLSPAEVYSLLGERMFDRLMGFGTQSVHMPGPSLRRLAAGGKA